MQRCPAVSRLKQHYKGPVENIHKYLNVDGGATLEQEIDNVRVTVFGSHVNRSRTRLGTEIKTSITQ